MRASFKTLLVALVMAGCSVYEDPSGALRPGTTGTSGSGDGSGSGGSSGGFAGVGGSAANDASFDARAGADADGATSGGAAGASIGDGASDRGGTSGAAGSATTGGAAGSGATAGTGGSAGGDGSAGAGGTSGTAGSSGASGSSSVDASSGVDSSDTGRPCVSGTGPASLPFAVDQYFFASGWMQSNLIHQDATCAYPPSYDAGSTGDAGRDATVGADSVTGSDGANDRDGSSMSDRGTVPPLPGSKCWTITYVPTSPADWAGVDWQYPINNWGASNGLVIPPGATGVSVVAWGDIGGETIAFNVGYGPASPDTFGVTLNNQVLTTTPTRYIIDMSGILYTCSSVRMGFGWVASGDVTMTFHLADIRWE